MKSSIRKFLLLNLLLAITVTTTLTALGNYYLDQKVIQEHLDTFMAVSALSYQALADGELPKKTLAPIQAQLNRIPQEIDRLYQKNLLNSMMRLDEIDKFNIQIWSKEKLLLHSARAPLSPLYTEESLGFSNKMLDKESWRVFSAYNKDSGLHTVVGERHDTRNQLGRLIAQDDFYIMLLTFPLSGLLIWIIIGRGLASLEKVAAEVANRAPSHLEPVNLEAVPQEIKPVIDELNKLFCRLQEGFEREKRFAADAAHELKTPLAALKAQAQVALNINDIAEKNKALAKLIASVDRSTHIVQQLLIMSRLVPESATLNDMTRVNLVSLSQETLAILALSAIEKGVELEFESAKGPANIVGNPTALSILIRNLADNAIRYCQEQGRVLVSISQQEEEIILQVSDNGPGIPQELQQRVFERFFRVLGNKSPGSGLGLAIVQQICALHNARIELAPQKIGSGLVVSVFFPQAKT